MGHAFLFAGILGLVAFAFGQHTAVRLAQAIILGVVALVALAIMDKLTMGRISDALVPPGRYCYSDCP
jgi:VIT1/CCC1 family predicted Fe2+/Mn2+ transporter